MRRGRAMSTGNSATTRPGRLDSRTTRSPRRAASRTLWVTNRTVSAGRPARSARAPRGGGRGSSRRARRTARPCSRTSASWASARARATRWRIPPDSSCGRLLARSRRGGRARAARRRARAARASGRRAAAARARRSRPTVSHGNSAASWNISAGRPPSIVDGPAGRRVEAGDEVEERASCRSPRRRRGRRTAGRRPSDRAPRGRRRRRARARRPW